MKFSRILKYVFIWQLAILVVTLAAIRMGPLRLDFLYLHPPDYLEHPLQYSRANFDGVYYVLISRHGYGFAQQAFFPLYPKLIRLFLPYLDMPVLVGILISLGSFILGLHVLSKLLRLDYPEKIVRWIIILLLVFPVSFFFSAVYTEGLFFLTVVSCFYFARTRRWLAAGIIGALAAYTKFIGIILLPALLIEFWDQYRGQIKSNLSHLIPLLLIPLGLLSYMIFLDKTTGDPLAFIHVQELFNQGRSDKIVLLYQVFWRYLKMIFTVNRSDPLYQTILLEFAVSLIFFFTSLYSLLRHRLSYAFFNIAAFIIPTLTGTLTSVPRYVLICFPGFIILGQLLSGLHPLKKYLVLVLLGALSVIYLSLFVRGFWVA